MEKPAQETIQIVPRPSQPNRHYLCCLTGEYRYERDVIYDVKIGDRIVGTFQEGGIPDFSHEAVEKRLRISFRTVSKMFAALEEAKIEHPAVEEITAARAAVTEFGIEQVQASDWVTVNESWAPENPEPPNW